MFKDEKRLPEFNRDLKQLSKKYRTLEDDLNVFIKNQLFLYHKKEIDNGGIVEISGLNISELKIYKARKFSCKSLKGKGAASGIRVIYAYYEKDDIIELIEIYYKGDKETEDRRRIAKYYQ